MFSGSESEGTARFLVSWNISGIAPTSTDYYILPMGYKGDVNKNDNNLPAAAIEGSDS